jgi:hypothetical protein
MSEQNPEFYILINGEKIEVNEGYVLEKIDKSFVLKDDKKNVKQTFKLNHIDKKNQTTIKGGTVNHRFNNTKKTKQKKNKSIKKHRNADNHL